MKGWRHRTAIETPHPHTSSGAWLQIPCCSSPPLCLEPVSYFFWSVMLLDFTAVRCTTPLGASDCQGLMTLRRGQGLGCRDEARISCPPACRLSPWVSPTNPLSSAAGWITVAGQRNRMTCYIWKCFVSCLTHISLGWKLKFVLAEGSRIAEGRVVGGTGKAIFFLLIMAVYLVGYFQKMNYIWIKGREWNWPNSNIFLIKSLGVFFFFLHLGRWLPLFFASPFCVPTPSPWRLLAGWFAADGGWAWGETQALFLQL